MNARRLIRHASVAVALAITSLGPATHAAGDPLVPFQAIYQGPFTLSFVTGVLDFSGDGLARHLGHSTIVGASVLVPEPTNPLCSVIVQDAVTLTAANGDQLFLVNAGTDCLDPTTGTITGAGTMTIAGGTGRFWNATGAGTFSVVAQVQAQSGAGASGVFDLVFTGQISR